MNKIHEVIKAKERLGFHFAPTHEFYRVLGIGKKKFGAIMRNELQPTLTEIKTIAKVIGVKASELIDIELIDKE